MKKKEKLAEMIAELAWAKKEAKRLYRVSEKNREKARLADNFMCRLCGFNVVTEVHHIIPSSKGGSDKLSNLVTLCPNHHAMADRELITREELTRAVARRTDRGRLVAACELVEYVVRALTAAGDDERKLEELRYVLKAELPSKVASVYGALKGESIARLNDRFERLFCDRAGMKTQ